MKFFKISLMMLAAGLVVASCNDIDEQEPEGGSITGSQLVETNSAVPSRVNATFSGMFTMMGQPNGTFNRTSARADDFGFIMAALSLDAEGADLVMADNTYNWFSAACELSSRDPQYANPYIRYTLPYRQIGVAQQIISSFPADTQDSTAICEMAQAHAMRAFDYLSLAPYFAGNYANHKDDPCVPLLNDGVDYTNNPRATVAEVYAQIISDLDYAIEHLGNYKRTDKSRIDQHVAYGLRARANLAMGNYAQAASDAENAMKGYTPATRSEVSTPGFNDISSHNWIWGIDITDDQLLGTNYSYCTSSSWLCALSGDGYAAATGNTPAINEMLFKLIPSTDIRKGWWLDGNKHSDNWANLTWGSATGDAIADLVTSDGNKIALSPYTNIKFGQKSGVGSTINNNDWPLMRVEEMILIEAEGLAKSGQEAKAREVLTNFVKTYRDPSYTIPSNRSLADEIWFQRRVELWGEGFFTSDARRLGKNIVRFHNNVESNFPDAHKFNISADDQWLNLRFPTDETENNHGIVNNTGGSLPESLQNPTLTDGVTD
jgi:hypothetical protein